MPSYIKSWFKLSPLHLNLIDRSLLIKCMAYGKIVDIGCFDGHFFGDLAVNVDWKQYADNIPNFIIADANNLPFRNQVFNCAVVSELLEHASDPSRMLKEAERVSNIVIIGVPNEYEWDASLHPFSGSSSHQRFFNQRTLLELVNRSNLYAIECIKVNMAGWSHYIVMAASKRFGIRHDSDGLHW